MTHTSRIDKPSMSLGWWPFALVLVVGAALRLFQLGTSSFWYDEAQTLLVARLPLGQIALTAYRPPLYHYLLHFWSLWVPSTEFWLRLPSLVFGLGVVVLVPLVARQLYDRRTALLAMVLAAISPVLVYYAQELRMYSLLALLFLVIFYLFNRIILLHQDAKWQSWVALGLVEALALYTHYFSVPFILTISLVALVALIPSRHWRTLYLWFLLQAGALVAFVPWLLVILRGRGGIDNYVSAELAPINPIVPTVADFLRQFAAFYSQGPEAWDQPLDRVLLLVIGGILAGVFLLMIYAAFCSRRSPDGGSAQPGSADSPRRDIYLLLVCLVPVAVSAVLFHFRPGVVSPRHLMMVAGPLLILVARAGMLLWNGIGKVNRILQWGGRALAAIFIGAVIGILGYAQLRNMRDPERLRPNIRALVSQVLHYAGSNDLVLLAYQDYAFDYYMGSQARLFHLETRVSDTDLMTWALPRLAGAQRAVLLKWVQAYADPRDYLQWFLQVNGRLVHQEWVADRYLSAYELNSPLVLPEFTPIAKTSAPLAPVAGYWPTTYPADQPLPVGLQWLAVQAPAGDYKASLRLSDANGYRIASDDRVLLAEQTQATSGRWLAGAMSRNYYLLQAPLGTAPITYNLSVTLYGVDGEIPLGTGSADAGLSLGMVQLTPAASFPDTFPETFVMTRTNLVMTPGVQLVGYTIDRGQLQPGSGLFVTLYWKALQDNPADLPVTLALAAPDDRVLGSQDGAPANGQYPFTRWHKGELVADRRLLRANLDAAPGSAKLQLNLGGLAPIDLGQVTIEKSVSLTELPQAQYAVEADFGGLAGLRGYDLAATTLAYGRPFTVTLDWEALGDQPAGADYTVFVHLLSADGRVIAQHDGAPVAGTAPTSGWLAGQYYQDEHSLSFNAGPAYSGSAELEVGLYDPRTNQRLVLPDGADHLVLPVKVEIN